MGIGDYLKNTAKTILAQYSTKPVEKSRRAVCQLTSAHLLEDERILHRMAWSLKKTGFESYVVGPKGQLRNYKGVFLIPTADGNTKSGMFQRLKRTFQIPVTPVMNRYDILQLHDPDLLLIAPFLKLAGKRLIYDVHDDYEASVKDRLGGRPVFARMASKLWWFFEICASWFFDGVIVADRHLARKFAWKRPVILGNYPRMDFTPSADTSNENTFNIIYVGGISEERGVGKVLDAIDILPYPDIRLHLVGECRDAALSQRIRSHPKVIHFGRVAWTELYRYYTRAHMGVALYQPLASFEYYTGENAVKIIEYMAAGIPVLCSDFPGLRLFVEKSGFGLTSRPDDPAAIAEKIRYLHDNPDIRENLGRNGRKAFETEYNWEKHEAKLLALYERILKKKHRFGVW